MARFIAFLLFLVWTIVAFAAVLSALPLAWPLGVRLGLGVGLSLALPAVAGLWLFSLLHRREVAKNRMRLVLLTVITLLQGALIAAAVLVLEKRPNDLLTGLVALIMDEPPAMVTIGGPPIPAGETTSDTAGEIGTTLEPTNDSGATGNAPSAETDANEAAAPRVAQQPRSSRLGLEIYHLWSKRLGGDSYDAVVAIAVTPKGETVVVGKVIPTAGPGNPNPVNKVSISWVDANGSVRWHKLLTATQIEAVDVTTDAAGNIFVLGAIRGALDLGYGSNPDGLIANDTERDPRAEVDPGPPKALLLKLDPTGGLVWQQQIEAPNGAAQRIGVAPGGDILVAGTFPTVIKIGTYSLKSTGPGNLFILRLTASGQPRWLRQVGDSRKQVWAEEIGFFRDETTIVGQYIGGGPPGRSLLQPLGPETDERGVFMLQMTSTGEPIASIRLQYGYDQGMGFGATFDAKGDVVLARGFWGEIKGDGYSRQSADALDVFLGKFDRRGHLLWSHRFGGAHDQGFVQVATDQQGRVFIAGSASVGIDLGHGQLTASGTADVFMAVFSPLGEPIGSCLFTNSFRGGAGGLAVDHAGKLILAGTFPDAIDLGGGSLRVGPGAANPQPDIFVAKLAW